MSAPTASATFLYPSRLHQHHLIIVVVVVVAKYSQIVVVVAAAAVTAAVTSVLCISVLTLTIKGPDKCVDKWDILGAVFARW